MNSEAISVRRTGRPRKLVSQIATGLAFLVTLGASQAGATPPGWCESTTLDAARSYLACRDRATRRAAWHDAVARGWRCDGRLERRLARTGCGSTGDAAALGRRRQVALGFQNGAATTAMAGEARFTPVVMSVLAPPHPVTGSDGRTHLVYEFQITNASFAEWQIEAIEVLDGDDPARVLLEIAGDEVSAHVQSLGDRSALNGLEPGRSALVFIHLPIEPHSAVPNDLIHRLTLSLPGGIPESLRVFAGLPPDATVLEEVGAHVTVADRAPPVLGAPLRGGRWIAADGCCVAPRHVRAVLTINGELSIAQRFAIDWERLNEDDRIYVGERTALESYFAYGEPVLAVADARVVRVVDGLEEQVPGALPSVIPLDEADGNHVVLDLGDGHFVLYAHMIPGSITVAEGDRVARGDVLGLVGNSGNTLAPHLHLHVMSTPSGLASDGLPYIIDGYELLGRAPSTEAFDDAEASGEPLEIVPVEIPGAHRNDLPLDQSVVRFHGD